MDHYNKLVYNNNLPEGDVTMKNKMFQRTFGRMFAGLLLIGTLAGAQKPLQAQAAIPAEFACIFDANYYASRYPEVAALCGYDENMMLNHFVNAGIAEGRQGSAEFDVNVYMTKYPDLRAAFGNDITSYYVHYMTVGKAEGRTAVSSAAPSVAAQKPAQSNYGPNNFTDKRNMEDHLRWEMQAAINNFRVNNQAVSLSNNTEIIDAAQLRADELTQKYDRIRPDGRNGDSVLEDKNLPRHYYRELLYRSNNGDVSEIIAEWTRANADVKNVLQFGKWRMIGVGHREYNGIHYWAIELTDGDNVLKEGSDSGSGNYLRERYRTDYEKEHDDEEEYRRQYLMDHPQD